jgi:pimeloyl-ACP methyl ester carboxylesterase
MGSEDYLFLPPVKNVVKEHTKSILKVVEKCGHVVNVEKPEVFNRITIDFLKSKNISANIS